MYRKLIVMGLLATPAFALAAGQPPSESARDHPAFSAHANATAGAADAQRIEACTRAAGIMINTLEKGDARTATSDFDATMQEKLGPDKLGEVWKQVEGKLGKLQKIGTPQNMMYQGYAVVIQSLHFETGDLDAQVACDADGRIAGFFLHPGASSVPASDD
ncbi:MAG TPA: DUF3887 domain-containing protein [Rhodanobacteraceae bacterium]|nr:DUF3887 domain-containing protein [Rhodanobacteraceae bacterium]